MMEWIQSFQGIMVLTFGGMSLGAISANVYAAIRGLRNAKTTSQIVSELEKAKGMVLNLLGLNESKDQETSQAVSLVEESRQVEAYLLKAMAIIIASSTAIDPIAKISLVGDLELMKKTIEEKTTTMLKQKADEVIKDLKVDTTKIIKETVDQSKVLIDKHSKA